MKSIRWNGMDENGLLRELLLFGDPELIAYMLLNRMAVPEEFL